MQAEREYLFKLLEIYSFGSGIIAQGRIINDCAALRIYRITASGCYTIGMPRDFSTCGRKRAWLYHK
jgi:hypothetical protein